MKAPNLEPFEWLTHGFGVKGHEYPAAIRLVRQIHSCLILDTAELDGPGLSDGDALICRTTRLLVGVKTADCVPVLLADPDSRMVAAVHAGWRGSADNIIGLAVRRLVEAGVEARRIVAAVGPSIGPCCYETGSEVASRFDQVFRFKTQVSGTSHLDLPAVNEAQLRAEGVSNIWVARECTFCNAEKFESFRRDGEKSGRMISYIGVQ